MRFLHTSDWHLGRQFHNISLLEDQRHVLDQLVDIVRDRHVDAVLVSGDVYDRSVPPAGAVSLLDDVIHRINTKLGVPMLFIAGNHDSAERLGFGARALARNGIHIMGQPGHEPASVVLADDTGEVVFIGVPYADPVTVRHHLGVDVHSHEEAMTALLAQVQKIGRRSVVLAHCFVDGGVESESERPLSVGGVDRVPASLFERFDYAALGHLHAPQSRQWPHVRYSGSLLKYSFSEEKQHKSVTLVDMDAQGRCEIEKIPLQPRHDMRILEGYFDELLERGRRDSGREDYLLIRLLDTHAIHEPMNRLRDVYPNVLHLERPGLLRSGERRETGRERLAVGELPLFRDFYRQMTGDELQPEAQKLVAGILDGLHAGKVD
ncbi:MAG TPA: exonuclease SbcCD subunit D [Chromatiaceae bacterium]|nr:exonuclease SbcCD subunit D [Chromatiaceae bacterium]